MEPLIVVGDRKAVPLAIDLQVGDVENADVATAPQRGPVPVRPVAAGQHDFVRLNDRLTPCLQLAGGLRHFGVVTVIAHFDLPDVSIDSGPRD
jgi:hypothetical protein